MDRTRMIQLPVSDDGPIGRAPMLGRWVVCFLLVRGADSTGNIQLAPGDLADAIGRRFGVDVGGRRVLRRLLPGLIAAGSVVPVDGGVHMAEWAPWNRHAQLDTWRRVYRGEPGRLADVSIFARGALIYLHKVVDGRGVFEGVPASPEGVVRALLRRRGGGEGWALDRALLGPLEELFKGRHLVAVDGHAAVRDFEASQAPRQFSRDKASSATQAPPADHPPATQAPPVLHARTTQHPREDHAASSQTPRVDHTKGDVTTRNDETLVTSYLLSNLSTDVRPADADPPSDRCNPPGMVTTERPVEVLVLTPPEPNPVRRRRGVPAPKEELPPPDHVPGARALYDVILGEEILKALVVNPSDFAIRSAVQFYDLNVAFVARDAAEYLSRPGTEQPKCGRSFLRNQFAGAMKRSFGLLRDYPYVRPPAARDHRPSASTAPGPAPEAPTTHAVSSDPLAALGGR